MTMRKAAIYTVGRQLNNGEMYIFTTYALYAAQRDRGLPYEVSWRVCTRPRS